MGGSQGAAAGSSIRDVAREAGVSTATVSRALRGLDRVSAATRAKVLRAADELQYVASPTAATLASGRTWVIGVVVPFLSRWFFATLLDGTEEVLRRNGYHILLFSVGLRTSTRTLMLDQRLLAKRVDALLVLAADLEQEEVAMLAGLGVPVVSVGVDLQPWQRVGIDDIAAGQVAIGHLVGLGHRHIAFVGGTPGEDVHTATAVERRAGVVEGLRQAGLTLATDLDLESDWTVLGGQTAGRRLLSLPAPPTAILGASDEMAIGVLLAARALGVAVPRQLSVVGIDDHEMAYSHDLTTVAQPVREQGRAAAQLVLDALSTADAPACRYRVLPTRLVVRGSTAAPHAAPAVGATPAAPAAGPPGGPAPVTTGRRRSG